MAGPFSIVLGSAEQGGNRKQQRWYQAQKVAGDDAVPWTKLRCRFVTRSAAVHTTYVLYGTRADCKHNQLCSESTSSGLHSHHLGWTTAKHIVGGRHSSSYLRQLCDEVAAYVQMLQVGELLYRGWQAGQGVMRHGQLLQLRELPQHVWQGHQPVPSLPKVIESDAYSTGSQAGVRSVQYSWAEMLRALGVAASGG